MVCSLSDAMGAKAARACDYCIRKRARWYCAADDAFLCQACDSSVHSANPLARRHGRVELNTTTSLSRSHHQNFPNLESIEPSWHPRKARTPRHGKPTTTVIVKNPTVHLVPEICSEENSHNDEEQLLLYRVPIFDTNNMAATEMELAEFAADVESLLGKGLDEESSFDMEGLGLGFLGDINNQEMECCFGFSHDAEKVVKVEEENNNNTNNNTNNNNNNNNNAAQVLMMNHTSNFDTLDHLKFDYDNDSSPNNIEEEEEEMSTVDGSKIIMRNKKTILLNLDYEGVVLAWSDQRSPWTTGQRPELNSYHATWPDCMQAGCGIIHPYDGVGMRSGQGAIAAMADGGREARVSRYREKRRSRLFSKKIRYEVRKLNAEKRPRMKGRFVKRPKFSVDQQLAILP